MGSRKKREKGGIQGMGIRACCHEATFSKTSAGVFFLLPFYVQKRALLPKVPVFKCKKWHIQRPNLRTESKNLAIHPSKMVG